MPPHNCGLPFGADTRGQNRACNTDPLPTSPLKGEETSGSLTAIGTGVWHSIYRVPLGTRQIKPHTHISYNQSGASVAHV